MTATVLRPAVRHAKSLVQASGGSAAVEFGVIASILVALIAGVADLGLLANRKATLDAAVRAGGQYARFDPSDKDTIKATVVAYANFSPALTVDNVTVTDPFCECDSGGTSDGTCDGTCPTGTPLHTYVTVSATQSYSAILPLSALGSLTSVTASVTMRSQ